jgi:hypothetical protein
MARRGNPIQCPEKRKKDAALKGTALHLSPIQFAEKRKKDAALKGRRYI